MLNRTVRKYANAWLFGWQQVDPETLRVGVDLTPQLLRRAWQYRRDIECRATHLASQRLSLVMCFNLRGYRRNLAVMSNCRPAAARHAICGHRQITGPISARKIRAIRKMVLDDVTRVDAGLGESLLAAARHAEEKKNDMSPEEYLDAISERQPLPPGTVRVLLSEPEKRPRDGNEGLVKGLEKPKKLCGASTRHEIDELYSAAYSDSPWLQEPIQWMWRQHLEMLKSGFPHFWLPPCVLVGPPGCGKTYLLQSIATSSGVPYVRIDMSALTANFAITGLESGWNSSRPGEPVSALSRGDAANPLILLDELEKAGSVSNAASPHNGLLPLLQKDTARDFRCPAIRANVDLSNIVWAAAANSIGNLPAPLLDRMTVLQCELPRGDVLRQLVEKRLGDVAAGPAVIDEVYRRMASGTLSLRGLDRLAQEFRRLNDSDPLN